MQSNDFKMQIWQSFLALNNTVVTLLKENEKPQVSIKLAGKQRSISDVISYHIGWCSLLISWYQAGIKGEKPSMPGAGFTTWDYVGLADYFSRIYSYDDNRGQLEHLEKLIKQVLLIVDKETQSGALDTLNVWEWCTLKSGKAWPLRKWIQVNTVAPFQRTTRELQKYKMC